MFNALFRHHLSGLRVAKNKMNKQQQQQEAAEEAFEEKSEQLIACKQWEERERENALFENGNFTEINFASKNIRQRDLKRCVL